MIRDITRAAWMVYTSLGLFAQSVPSIRQFEVASVKLHDGPIYNMGVTTSGSRLNADAANVLLLAMYAYHVKNYQVMGWESQPTMTNDTRYDIVAKAEGGAAPAQEEFRQMLQLLLADRFKLKVRTETREMPVYDLVVGKSGPKFKASAPDADPQGRYHWTGRNNEVTMPKAGMDDVINAIVNSMLDRPVLDKTGLSGTYNIKLIYTPDRQSNRDSGPDPNDISIFDAVQAQLGLKLEPQKAMVQVLIVDHVEKPPEN
jgi:uncharacterized protein (TIGR03435 family)